MDPDAYVVILDEDHKRTLDEYLGKNPFGFAKLLALVKEMPWLREASLNLAQYFKTLDPDGHSMPEFQEKLQDIIHKNGWTTGGMTKMTLGETG